MFERGVMMTIDINLLPERPKENYLLTTIAIVIIVITLTLLIVSSIRYSSLASEIDRVEKMTEDVMELQILNQTKLNEKRALPEVSQMTNAIKAEVVSAELIVDHLTRLLPENINFTNYTYQNNGLVDLIIQANDVFDISSLLHILNQDQMIDYVSINDITNFDDDAEVEAVMVASLTVHVDAAQAKRFMVDEVKEVEEEEDSTNEDE